MKSNGGTQYYQQDRVYDSESVAVALQATLPDGSNKYLVKENRKYRIRKLTPTKECSRLMGIEDADSANISKRQTERQQYHLYGDSIVTACLMAIFGELCGVDYESKIEEHAKNICEDRPAEYKQIDGGGIEVKIKSNTKCGYEIATLGDGINLAFPESRTRRGLSLIHI